MCVCTRVKERERERDGKSVYIQICTHKSITSLRTVHVLDLCTEAFIRVCVHICVWCTSVASAGHSYTNCRVYCQVNQSSDTLPALPGAVKI